MVDRRPATAYGSITAHRWWCRTAALALAMCATLASACTRNQPPPDATTTRPTPIATASTRAEPTMTSSPDPTPTDVEVQQTEPQGEPAGSDPDAVEPYVEHLLRIYDQTLTKISADTDIAADADHALYDDLRSVLAPDSDVADRVIANLVNQGQSGITQRGLVESSPTTMRRITGDAVDRSRNEVTFPVCVWANYRLYRASKNAEIAAGSSSSGQVTARRVDGRWRLSDFEAIDDNTCPKYTPPRAGPAAAETGETEPAGTKPAAVEPYIDRLLRTYDQTIAQIVADPEIAADVDHALYDELRWLRTPEGIVFRPTRQEPLEVSSLVRRGQAGIVERPLDSPLPIVRRRTGRIETESKNEVRFPLCAYPHYELYDRWGRLFETSTGPNIAQRGEAQRVDGRWRIKNIFARFGDADCPPESP